MQKKTLLVKVLILTLLVMTIAETLAASLVESGSILPSKVSAQQVTPKVIHKEITILHDGSFTVDYLCDNGTYVYDPKPELPISKSLFGDYYTFTGDVYGRLVIQKDNIVIDGAGYKLQVQGAGGFAVSVGRRDHNRNPEFIGTNNVVITNMEIVGFAYGIELAGSNNVVSNVTLTEDVLDGKAIWDSGSNNIIRGCRIFDNKGAGIYASGSGVISDNYIAHNSVGIEFPSSAGTLRNILLNNGKAFDFDTLPSSSEVIDASNIVDGKPVCFLVNELDKTVPPQAGYVF